MESMYLLIPLSVILILAVLGLFAWALQSGQFDDLHREGERILQADAPSASGSFKRQTTADHTTLPSEGGNSP